MHNARVHKCDRWYKTADDAPQRICVSNAWSHCLNRASIQLSLPLVNQPSPLSIELPSTIRCCRLSNLEMRTAIPTCVIHEIQIPLHAPGQNLDNAHAQKHDTHTYIHTCTYIYTYLHTYIHTQPRAQSTITSLALRHLAIQ